MKSAAKLSVYGAALALIVTGAYATGSAVGPLATASYGPGGMSGAEGAGHRDTHSGTVTETASGQSGGLASSRGGYTFTPTDPTLTPGTPETFSFHLTGPDGAAVTGFDVEHDKRMHLIVVRRDSTGFQHVHPEMASDDLVSAGAFEPAAHAANRTTQVDGYTGELLPGQASPVTLTVSRDGVPVTEFIAEVLSGGSYRLFLDFHHGGDVHTAEFTVPTDSASAPPPGGPAAPPGEHSEDSHGY